MAEKTASTDMVSRYYVAVTLCIVPVLSWKIVLI